MYSVLIFKLKVKFYTIFDDFYSIHFIIYFQATALPIHLLAPPQGSVILDMCAAPGMKTTQMAAYIRNQVELDFIIIVGKNE